MKGEEILKNILLKSMAFVFVAGVFLLTGENLWAGRRKNPLSVKACLKYMKDKYGMDFTPVEDKQNADITMSMLTFSVKTEKYPEQNILVVQERLDKGNTVLFHDNFVAVKYIKEITELVEKMSRKVFGDNFRAICEVESRCQPDEFNDKTTFEEFLSCSGTRMLDINILLPPEHSAENKEEDMRKLEQQFIENHIVGFCNIYYCPDDKAYRSIGSSTDCMSYGITVGNHRWYRENGQFDIDKELKVHIEMWR